MRIEVIINEQRTVCIVPVILFIIIEPYCPYREIANSNYDGLVRNIQSMKKSRRGGHEEVLEFFAKVSVDTFNFLISVDALSLVISGTESFPLKIFSKSKKK